MAIPTPKPVLPTQGQSARTLTPALSSKATFASGQPRQKLNLTLPPQIKRRLKAHAIDHDTSVSQIVEAWAREKLDLPD